MTARSYSCLSGCNFILAITLATAAALAAPSNPSMIFTPPLAAAKTIQVSTPRALAESPQTVAKPAQAKPLAPVSPPLYMMYWVSLQQSGSVVHTWDLQPQYSVGPMPFGYSFKSLADPELRQWVSRLPAGASINCGMWMGPYRMGKGFTGDSAALEGEISGFTQYCKSKQVVFCPAMSGG